MRLRELAAAALLVLTAAVAQAEPCALVFGQGRNPPKVGGPDWDGLNERFNAGVAGALETAGRRIFPSTTSAVQIDPEAAGIALLQQADRLGCATLIETALFVDEQDTLILRLRVFPLLPLLGDSGGVVGLRVGAPVFVTQRDMALTALPRLKPDVVAQQMAAEYLQHDRK